MYNMENNFGVGADVQFNAWYNEIDSITAVNAISFTDSGSVKNYEFQAALYVTYNYKTDNGITLIPYAGCLYSNLTSNIDDAIKYQDINWNYTVGDLDSKDNFGLLVGANVGIRDNFELNLEGRFIAETAATAGLGYKF